MSETLTALPALRPAVLLGLPVHPVTLEEAVERLLRAVAARSAPVHVVSLNGALVMQALRDPDLAAVIRAAGLVIPDGIGTVLAGRILDVPVRRRVAGVDVAEALCREAARHGYRVYLLGAAPGVAEAAASRLRERYPGFVVAGTDHGYFGPEDESAVLARIRAARPDILLVALGAPRQERWLHRHAATLGVPVVMGVGGTLDVLAGRVRRAPRWMQALGLEWLYRMVRQPWRWSVVRTIPPLFAVALRERVRRLRRKAAAAGAAGGEGRAREAPARQEAAGAAAEEERAGPEGR
ncbi:MAG: WecB/TagA/CpsF family glycosyltransferase [Armatimonadota bacterium]|nr:WecB/TagA/CpsF family glycosyltransferase [Armatimonadota bacterium]MDR7575422.1 WecB/TagA/CpsF family glycosyltransferase [Armatimonadota bacterium]MDR7586339.1 WecB/TagA/CpsF family glycosyltransferase [Armatimonadota bacterium]